MKMPPIDQLKDRPLGRVLIKMGRLTREQVHQALAVQADQKNKGARTPIGQILVDLGMITEKDRNIALAAQKGLEMYDLEKDIPADVISKMTPQMATWLASVTGQEPLDDELVIDDPLIADAQIWLGNRFTENVRIADLAKALSVSHQTLIRHFRRRLDTTPLGYIQRLRAQSAQRMLETTNRPIDEIARLNGYNDTRTFRAMFREQVGMSASTYRANARRKAKTAQ